MDGLLPINTGLYYIQFKMKSGALNILTEIRSCHYIIPGSLGGAGLQGQP